MRFFLSMLVVMLLSGAARADDGGDAGSDAQTTDEGVPLACEGGLCDTTNGSTCNVGGSAGALLPVIAVLALIAARRRRALAVLATLVVASPASAEPQAVDVVVKDPAPVRRWISIEVNPLPMITIGRFGGNIVVVPVDHHAVILSPYWATATTEPIYVYDDQGKATQLPKQTFSGFAGELGYRYYTGLAGPRGFFLGPSFILGAFTASPMAGSDTHYMNIGGALDVGYQALILDRVSLSLGGGLQFLAQDKTLPSQQFPAKIYANTGVLPRLLLSIGVAL